MRRGTRRAELPPGVAVLAVALAGLTVLAAALAWTAAPHVALADLAAHEGARVAADARVLAAHPRALTLADATARVVAFPPRGVALPAAGDEVRALGTVTRGPSGGLALSLERVTVLASPGDRVLAVGDLAREPMRYAGSPVAVAGALERPKHEGWRLVDAWTGDAVALDVSPVPDEWEPGAGATVEGRFVLDARRLRFVVAVESWRPSW